MIKLNLKPLSANFSIDQFFISKKIKSKINCVHVRYIYLYTEHLSQYKFLIFYITFVQNRLYIT